MSIWAVQIRILTLEKILVMLPIDKLKVERIEAQNNGSHIYLHLETNSVVWVACGDSAYLLRLFVKKIGCSYLCGYSDRLQMPCVLVDADVARKVKSYLEVEPCDDDSLLCLSGCGDIDKVDYTMAVSPANCGTSVYPLAGLIHAQSPVGALKSKSLHTDSAPSLVDKNWIFTRSCFAGLAAVGSTVNKLYKDSSI